MAPVRDPVKNLVYYAEMENLDTVLIDGTVVVEDGTVLHTDECEVARRLQHDGERLWPQMAEHDWAGLDVETLSPQTFPRWPGP